ncbi:Superoxide dismutase [Mn], mitochondrial [Saitozyma sp. JCM 24511]|nr:Superoxide dismutase [Mn], mitochondrial [Saitozyma sp. JCM 24511]
MVALVRTGVRAALPVRGALMATMAMARGKHTLPDLPYGYDALEPSISKEIMTLHHTKHHQTYVNGLNAAEESLAKLTSEGNVKGAIALQPALKFNGGGHINHSLFWKNLAPSSSSSTKPSSAPTLVKQIEADFGGLDKFKEQFNAKTAAIQGSGWGWLGWNKESKVLEIVTTANQDPLLSHVPIIGIDIWEHAFYLQYKNVKPDYLKAIWDVINFEEAESRFKAK